MKRLVIALAILTVAEPALAQVLVGRRTPRSHPRPAAAAQPQGLTVAEEDRLISAQDEVADVDQALATLQAQIAGGTALSPEQTAIWEGLQIRRQRAQATIDALTAKQDAARPH